MTIRFNQSISHAHVLCIMSFILKSIFYIKSSTLGEILEIAPSLSLSLYWRFFQQERLVGKLQNDID